MKILIDAHPLGEGQGGNETYFLNLVKGLSQIDKENIYEIIVGKRFNKDLLKLSSNFSLTKIFSRDPLTRLLFELSLRGYDSDFVTCQYFVPPVLFKKAITVIHDVSFEVFPEFFELRELLFFKFWVRLSAKISKKIAVVSNFLKNKVQELYRRNKDVYVTFNSVDREVFKPMSKSEKREFSNSKGLPEKYLLFVGNINTKRHYNLKNFERLVNAFSKFASHNKSTKLLVVGAEPSKENLNALQKRYSILDFTVFCGRVPLTELRGFYSSAQALIIPSVWETFGIPSIEAMACGTPCVLSFCDALKEIASDSALFFNPYDEDDIKEKIKEIFENEKKREKLIENGFKRVKNFTIKKQATSFFKLLN